jgi:CheY-like chemotaxis protein
MTKVLLVDDDEIARSALAAELEESGFEVTIASNVLQALKLIATEKWLGPRSFGETGFPLPFDRQPYGWKP